VKANATSPSHRVVLLIKASRLLLRSTVATIQEVCGNQTHARLVLQRPSITFVGMLIQSSAHLQTRRSQGSGTPHRNRRLTNRLGWPAFQSPAGFRHVMIKSWDVRL
jgi:hypothetical protein